MNEKRTAKWQAGTATLLEPGERVITAAPGQKAEGMLALIWAASILESVAELVVGSIPVPLPSRGRAYVVTDRHVYLCRLSSTRNHKVEEVLEKRRLGEASMEFRRNRLTLDATNPVYVGWLPAARRWAREAVSEVNAHASASLNISQARSEVRVES